MQGTAASHMGANEVANNEFYEQQLQQAEEGKRGVMPIVEGRPVVGVPVIGVPVEGPTGVPVIGQHMAVMTAADLPDAEITALRYRRSVMCFAIVDLVTVASNVIPSWTQHWQLGAFGCIFFLGPLCGLCGARMFNRCMTTLYLTLCVLRCAWQLYVAAVCLLAASLLISLWAMLIALLNVWFAKIVWRFWAALGDIHPERRTQLREGKIDRTVQMVYW
jgi:hypothetical protein